MIKKKLLKFDIQQVEQNIIRCDENVKIFQDQVEKQQEKKIELEILKRELEDKLKNL